MVLRSATLIPAEILGVSNRIGSLEVGKDADIIIIDGPPSV
jgi:imidazolonepropionase-like amidohydrolase